MQMPNAMFNTRVLQIQEWAHHLQGAKTKYHRDGDTTETPKENAMGTRRSKEPLASLLAMPQPLD